MNLDKTKAKVIGKPAKIAYNVMIQSIKNGRMKLVDFESKLKALKFSFIKWLLNNSPDKWENMANHFYNTRDLEFYFKCNPNENPRIEHKIYYDVHNYWFDLSRIKEIDSFIVSNQVLWNNRYITIKMETLYMEKLVGMWNHICVWYIRRKWRVS